MELLETTPIPWAQGVGRSNRPAPTNLFNNLERFSNIQSVQIGADCHGYRFF